MSSTVTSGSVLANLLLMRGVWHDHLQGYAPDGTPLDHDEHGGTPGRFPYEQLVYLDVTPDGVLRQTNVVLRGRPAHERTFSGRVVDGVLRFDALGPNDPGHLGVSGGPGVLVFLPERVDGEAVSRFYDPDWIRYLGGDQRTRTTTLYRFGELRRVLTVSGTRIATDPARRVPIDPRGPDGPVHEGESVTQVYVTEESS